MAGNIWALLPTKTEGGAIGGIWRQVSTIIPRVLVAGEQNIWSALENRPGGMWQELGSETLLLRGRKWRDIWTEVNEETLIIRPHTDIWLELKRAPLRQASGAGLWEEVTDQTLLLQRSQEGVWEAVSKTGNFTQYKPMRRLGWALKKLQTAGGEEYSILKNMRLGTYLRLSEEQVFLWNLMDGQHTDQDLAVAYFVKYKSLAIQRLLVLLGQLEAKGFLIDQHVNLYAHTAARLGQGRGKTVATRLWGAFTQTTFAIHGIDGLLTKIYRAGVFLIFNPVVQGLMLLITLAGLGAFIYQMQAGTFSVLTGGGEYVGVGIVMLYVAQFIAIFLHEAAHAFTCKHFKREVRRAGFMLYLGMPAFFVDTTDIWMDLRRPRILVSWAGPYSGFFLAGVASLLTLVIPDAFVAGLLYQFAFACNLLSFTNLNPLLQLDGYYILMDWLEMPMLRVRAMRFIQGDAWRKLRKREKFGRDEIIYAVYGALALVWTAVVVFSVLQMAGSALLGFLQKYIGPDWGLVVMIIVVIGLAVLLLWPFVRGLFSKKQAAVLQG